MNFSPPALSLGTYGVRNNIRINTYGFETAVMPNQKQIPAIEKIIMHSRAKNTGLYVDIADKNGKIIKFSLSSIISFIID